MAITSNGLKNFSNLICGDNYFVSQCKKCGKIKFNYNNILLDMDPEKYRSFAELLDSVSQNNSYPTEGNPLILINYTDHKELTLIFEKEEFEEIKKIIHESILMLDVNGLIEDEKNFKKNKKE